MQRNLSYSPTRPAFSRTARIESTLISSLEAARCRELIAQGVIEGGMIPKVEACLESLERQVRKTHIIDGRLPHSLLLEIYTDRGVGTEIRAGNSTQANGGTLGAVSRAKAP